MDHLFFFIGLSLLLTHELDAIRLKEWKLFFFLSWMPEESAFRVFTAIHVPLFLFFFWGIWGSESGGINSAFVAGANIFFIVHVVLHVLFWRHRDYQFKTLFSWVWILGAGVCGAVDLLMYWPG